jgi:hypothetical protein
MCYLISALKNYEKRGREREFTLRKVEGFEENDIFAVKKILRQINVTENTAIGYLQVLKLPVSMQREISWKKRGYDKDGKLTIGQAEQLCRVEDSEYQKYLFDRAITGVNQKRLQALVNEYKKKLEVGEWKGFPKKEYKGGGILKNPIEKSEELSALCKKLSSKIRSYSIDTLVQISETMEGEEFVASMKELKRELELLRNRIHEKLLEKGFFEIKKDVEPFDVDILPMKNRGMMRFSLPMSVAREINIPFGKPTRIRLKVVAVKK